jgi:peptidoglycan pentaglycine glycine transferase (the first glycine)
MKNTSSLQLKRINELSHWNELIIKLPGAHLLQTREWSQIKDPVGWSPLPVIWEDGRGNCVAACLILKRQIRILPGVLSASILYAPKGPLLDWSDQSLVDRILSDLKKITKDEKSLFIKIDPDVVYGTGIPATNGEATQDEGVNLQDTLQHTGWHFSENQIQFRNTVIIDLTQSDDRLLEKMKQKTRYNIRLATKKGVQVQKGSLQDSFILYKMYAETSLRNGFTIRERQYYERVWQIFYDAGMLEFLVAYFDDDPIAGLVLIHFGKQAYYFYGMSNDSHREMMPTYLLQWEAIKSAREMGCDIYNLWGAPEEFTEQDPMWGVFRFKEGLGGQVIRTIGAWDYTINPLFYGLYTWFMPSILAVMRSRGKERTLQDIG